MGERSFISSFGGGGAGGGGWDIVASWCFGGLMMWLLFGFYEVFVLGVNGFE